ncbi:LysM domain-containing protein [Fusarium solani]|uniref:LysM domain-containing protein n=1 Tax=Fusarium solani TaxID=169388 RepID=A0A9P9G1F4_FUSSL|nr:LysM domain-containing protein [Fusarium solani]KAH7228396.1 LysM domain-containing protein [Fusarium solani]
MVALKLRQLALAAAVANVASLPLHAREGNEPGLPHDDATTSYCSWWADYDGSQTCKELLDWNWIELEDFRRWNPSIGPDCDGIESGRSYCVEAWDEPGLQAEETATSKTSPTLTTTGKVTISKVTTSMIAITSPPSTTVDASNGIKTPDPVHDGIVDNCASFHLVEEGDSCSVIAKKYGGIASYNKIELADFFKWNPEVDKGCTNLWLGAYACAGVIGSSPKPTTTKATTTTKPGNGITTPTPTQPGMVNDCNKFHIIGEKTTCQGIADYNKISLVDFFKWNPEVDKACTNLWLGAYACAGVIGSTPKPTTTAKPTVTQPGNGISTPTPIQAGMVSNCNKFHIIGSTTTCQGIIDYNKITMANFKKWNTGINSACPNLWLGSYACVRVIGGTSPAPTTTKPAGGIVTPTPTQAGMVKGCTKFHEVRTTTTCQGILNYNKITLAQFVKWNPAVGKDCSNLWSGTHACVAGP